MRLKVALVSLVVPTIVLLGGFVGISPALADYSAHPVFQVAISANCNNPSVCGADQLGGFWGWAAFNIDRSADGEFTGCGHLQRAGGPGTAGAGHTSIDAQWFIGKNGDFFTRNETDTSVGRGGTSSTFTARAQDTMIPSRPGHFNTLDVMGFTAPGVSFQLQVVLIPHWGSLFFGTAGQGVTSGSVSSNSASTLRGGAIAGSKSASGSRSAWWGRFGRFFTV
jgi:predicted outer membrane repeat protein